MPQVVEIKGVGDVEFPDSMGDEAVAKAAKKLYLEGQQQAEASAHPIAKAVNAAMPYAEQLVYGATPEGLVDTGGRLLKYAGNIAAGAAEDRLLNNPLPVQTIAAARDLPRPNPGFGPWRQGLVDAAAMTPVIAAGLGMEAVGVPPLAAFSVPMGAQGYVDAKLQGASGAQAVTAGAQAALTGMVIPGVGKAGAGAAGKVLATAVERGLLSGKRTAVQKAAEALGTTGAISVFMEGLSVPEYVAASPQEREEMLIRHMVANTVWSGMAVPDVLSPNPSRTQVTLYQRAGDILRDVAKDPVAWEAFKKEVDDIATWDAAELAAQGKLPPVLTKAGTPEAPPVPEPPQALAEQFRLTADPKSTRTATLITPGAEVPDIPDGLEQVKTKHGTVVFNPEKTDAPSIAEAASGDLFDTRVLGMSGQPVAAADTAVTTSTPKARNVAAELVTPEGVTAAVAAQQRSVPGGLTEVKPAETVIAERVADAQKGGPSAIQESGQEVPQPVRPPVQPAASEGVLRDQGISEAAQTAPPTLKGGVPRGQEKEAQGQVPGPGLTAQQPAAGKPRRLPAQMTAGEINKRLDRLDVLDRELTDEFIAAGRGNEKPSDYLRLDDPLSRRARALFDERSALRIEVEARYGPNAPSRLPARGFGPRSSGTEVRLSPIVPGVPGRGLTQGLPPANVTVTSSLSAQVSQRANLIQVRDAVGAMVSATGGNLTILNRKPLGRVRGVFRTGPRVVQLKNLNDLPAVVHEAGHEMQQALFPGGFGTVPTPVQAELLALGQALYGSKRPKGGYRSEGWAEFLRHWLSTDDAPKLAPATYKWFNETVLPSRKGLPEAATAARARIDVWRQQGLLQQVRQQTAPHGESLASKVRAFRRIVGAQGLFEAGLPLRDLREAARKAGQGPRPSEDPYELYKAFRGKSGPMLETLVREGMTDLWGRPTNRPGLREALAPVYSAKRPPGIGAAEWQTRFWEFMWAHQAKDMLAEGKNPGMSAEQADAVIAVYDNPQFRAAQRGFRQWNADLLDMVREASPAFAALADAMEQANPNYVPLAREFVQEATTRARDSSAPSSPIARRRGSARRVKEVGVQVLLSTENLVRAALREKVLDATVKLAETVPGLGRFLVEIPKARVEKLVNFDQLRKQLEDAGVDTTPIPDGTLLTFWQAMDKPSGQVPILQRALLDPVTGKRAGSKWYEVDPALWDAVQSAPRGWDSGVARLLLYAPAKLFRLATTGLRPSFGLITNPERDFPTFLAQSASGSNPFGRVADYLTAMGAVTRHVLAGGRFDSEVVRSFLRSGVTGATFLGSDINRARWESLRLGYGPVVRRLTMPLETLRELFSYSELVPRLAEWKRIGREAGWDMQSPLTPDQIVRMTNAAKQVTTDFAARGDFGGDPLLQTWVQSTPFMNAGLQGTRAFARAFRDHPLRAFLYGIGAYTLPTLYNWWKNKDELWYRNLTPTERWQRFSIKTDDGKVLQFPKAQEWGAFFSILPEAVFDAAYQADPAVFKEGLGQLFEMTNPAGAPVLPREALQQALNWDFYWQRSIVPVMDVATGQLPGTQVAPYTSLVAKKLGELFPKWVSPRRVDHFIRSVAGGAFSDALETFNEEERRARRGSEPADVPIVGRQFRRGGAFSANSRYLQELYQLDSYWRGREANAQFPLSPREQVYVNSLRQNMVVIRLAQAVVEQSNSPEFRQDAYRKLITAAEQQVVFARKYGFTPGKADLPPMQPRIPGAFRQLVR